MVSRKDKTKLPKCFVRIDVAHYVSSIIRNVRKGFKKTVNLIRGVLGYFITCKSFAESERIIHALFTVILNEFNSPTVLKCANMLRSLVLTQNVDINDGIEMKKENSIDIFEKENISAKTYKRTLNYEWVKQILNSVEISDESSENMYFAPEYKKYLVRTFVRMPLWSNVMLELFGSDIETATSAAVENAFKEIKCLLKINRHKKPNLFLQQHLKSLSGHLKLALADQSTASNNPRKRRCASTEISPLEDDTLRPKRVKRSLSCEETFMSVRFDSDESNISHFTIEEKNPVENWRGKIEKTGNSRCRRAKQSILSKHDPEYFRNAIVLLKNGHETRKLTTIHTCSFDSLYTIFGVACLDYDSLALNYLNSESQLSKFLNEIIKAPKADAKKCNRLRNNILNSIFSTEYYKNSGNIKIDTKAQKFIDCETGIGSFFGQLVFEIDPNFRVSIWFENAAHAILLQNLHVH